MKHRLAGLALVSAFVTAAPAAFADVPNPTTTTSGTGGSSTSSGGDESGGGCSVSPGRAEGSAALVLGLGLALSIPLLRRRARRS